MPPHDAPPIPLDRRRARPVWLLGLAILAILLAVIAGCAEPEAASDAGAPASAAPATVSGSPLSAPVVLERMAQAYRQAKTYADHAKLHEHLEVGGQVVDEEADFSVAMERPNRLRMQVYQASLACDGQRFQGTIAELPDQILSVDAPAELSFEFVHSDPALGRVLTQGIAGGSPQLALLLNDNAVASFTADGQPPILMPEEIFEGRACYRVQVRRDDGQLIAWIDRENFLLRRLDYPTEGLRRQLSGEGQVGDVRLWVEFTGAQFDSPLPDVAFQFEAPENILRVRRLVAIPRPPAPSPLLGQPVGAFHFVDLEGRAVEPAELSGKVVVIDFWATWCGPCFQSLPVLNQVYAQLAENERVRFLAVSIDDPQVPHDDLKQSFAQAGLRLPIYRDLKLQHRDVFEVPAIPSLFILGPDGRVEDHELGYNPRLASELPARIEKLLAGESTYRDAIARHEARMAEYERAIRQEQQRASSDDAPVAQPVPPASEPEHFSRRLLWRNDELKRPGNVLVTRDGAVLVAAGFKQVAELGPNGAARWNKQLEIPNSAVVSYLRVFDDATGQRAFLGSASNQNHVFLFNEKFQPTLIFPRDENFNVLDAQLVDLDGDGQLEICLGYLGVMGVQCVTSAGQRIWQNRSMENVYSIAALGPDAEGRRSLLCAHSRGTLVAIDAAGEQQPEIVVSGRFIRHLSAADLDGDGQPELCGVSLSDDQNVETVVGLLPDGQELWSYRLPPGIHDQPIEMVTRGRLLPGAADQWLIAAADGSIHVLANDGRLVDKFHVGAKLTGLAATELGGKPALIISTPEAVEAWQMTPVGQ